MTEHWKTAALLPFAAAGAWTTLVAVGLTPGARFARERIEVTVMPRGVEVDGLYIYVNPLPFPVTQGLSYPFPTDDDHPAPREADVLEVDPESGRSIAALPAVWLRGRPYFSLRVPARGSAGLRVRYRQEARVPEASYILTTTRAWSRPLESGDYVLIPRGVVVTRSAYPLDGTDGLSFSRRDFMPEKDWGFSWLVR